MSNTENIILFLGLSAFLSKRLLRYLRYFQQEEYTPTRFIDWIKDNNAFDKRGTFVSLFGLAGIWYGDYQVFITLAISFLFLLIAILEEDPRKFGKKTLVLTQRAKSIYILALGLGFVLGALGLFLGELQKVPTLIVISNHLLFC